MTKSNIANVLDCLGESFDTVARVMREWRQLAVEAELWQKEVEALSELARLEERSGRDSSETRREVERVMEERGVKEEEEIGPSQGSAASCEKFADVNLDSESSEEEIVEEGEVARHRWVENI